MDAPIPKIGIGVMVVRDGKILLHKRKNAHGAGEYSSPGGHLEYMESFEGCARREAKEEADIEIENVRFLFLANLKKYAPKHYVHVQLVADWKSGEPKVMEPEKCEGWEWFSMDAIPTPCFSMLKEAVECYKKGSAEYYDA